MKWVFRVALSLAIWSALVMLLVWVLGNIGIYTSTAMSMARWHMFFNNTLAGLIGGMIEAAVIGYIGAYAFVYIYNMLDN